MLDRFLEGLNYYDYPSFQMALYSLLLAFVLSTVIAFIYRFTFKESNFSDQFFQAMILGSMVSAMVMMSVGDNLAAGFGIIGAVAIIRFRTEIKNPRNIIFIFFALSIGIASGVYGYAIAIAGTIIFSIVALLLHYSPFGGGNPNQFLINLDLQLDQPEEPILKELATICNFLETTEIREEANKKRMFLHVVITPGHDIFDLQKSLKSVNIKQFKIEQTNANSSL